MTLTITITKFMFIVVWKSMREMNDDLLGKIVKRAIIFLSAYFTLIGPPLKKTQNLAFCTGNFDDINDGKEWQWHGTHLYYSLFFGTSVITILILSVAIKVQKHRISIAAPIGIIPAPKNLESNILHLTLLTIIAFSVMLYLFYWMK